MIRQTKRTSAVPLHKPPSIVPKSPPPKSDKKEKEIKQLRRLAIIPKVPPAPAASKAPGKEIEKTQKNPILASTAKVVQSKQNLVRKTENLEKSQKKILNKGDTNEKRKVLPPTFRGNEESSSSVSSRSMGEGKVKMKRKGEGKREGKKKEAKPEKQKGEVKKDVGNFARLADIAALNVLLNKDKDSDSSSLIVQQLEEDVRNLRAVSREAKRRLANAKLRHELDKKFENAHDNDEIDLEKLTKLMDEEKKRTEEWEQEWETEALKKEWGKEGGKVEVKKMVSAYMAFQKDNLPILRAKNPGAPLRELRQALRKEWLQVNPFKAKKLKQLQKEKEELENS